MAFSRYEESKEKIRQILISLGHWANEQVLNLMNILAY